MKYLIRTILSLTIFLFLLIVISNYVIVKNAEQKTFDNINDIDKNKVGLVLGTAKFLSNGRINLYFKYRVKAAVELFKKGKIEYILVSGDNGNKSYDEPTDFKNELVKNGIPAEKIVLDYAGFRTLDSVVRAKKVFGQNSITFISQEFHNQRAIYLAENHGISAIAFNAKDVSHRYGLKTRIREYLAKTKAVIDIITNTQPKFLGKSIKI